MSDKSIVWLVAAGLLLAELLDQEASDQKAAAGTSLTVQKLGLVALPTAFSAAQSHGSGQAERVWSRLA